LIIPLKIIIITAPSGAGKTTILKSIMQQFPMLQFSISACTRNPRAGEVDGKDYYFMSSSDFQQAIREGAFLEWEMVYTDKYYGTPKKEIERINKVGQVPIVDIDVKGALNIKKMYPHNSLSIFIQPPSVETLKERLLIRGTETPVTLQERIDRAAYEISMAPNFDAVVVNDDLSEAISVVAQTITQYLNEG
jgi:guanylate kinase